MKEKWKSPLFLIIKWYVRIIWLCSDTLMKSNGYKRRPGTCGVNNPQVRKYQDPTPYQDPRAQRLGKGVTWASWHAVMTLNTGVW
jgi:hypothetical protein